MAKRKQAKTTSRQRQSQLIMREKAARKKRKLLIHRLQLAGLASAAVLTVAGGGWLWFSGTAEKAVTQTVDGAYLLTVKAGFGVQSIYLEGRNRTSMQELEQALGIAKGQSIFRADLDTIRESLENIKSVRTAAVERALPHTLYVRIVEREPVALWQNDGKLLLVDDKGVVMSGLDSTPYTNLPLITGEGAPEHVGELLSILSVEPDLAKRFAAAIYTGNRRWNIRMENGTEVKLPENEPLSAWRSLAELQTSQQLLDRSVKVIDLRLQGRLFITVAPQHMPAASDAKDT